MAKELPNPSERLRIDRRTLIKASIITANLAPSVPLFDSEPVVSVITSSTASDSIRNVCANTSRRLAEIVRRNELRRQASLPLISVAQEFRRLKTIESSQDFANFAERFRSRVQTKVLARIRRQVGDGDWKPNGALQGMAFQNEVSERLRRVYERVG